MSQRIAVGTMSFMAENLRVIPITEDRDIEVRKLVDDVAQIKTQKSVRKLRFGIIYEFTLVASGLCNLLGDAAENL